MVSYLINKGVVQRLKNGLGNRVVFFVPFLEKVTYNGQPLVLSPWLPTFARSDAQTTIRQNFIAV